MMNLKKLNNVKLITRWIIYIGGLLILSFGIVLNTKTGLGVSPIISVSYAIANVTGLNFGNVTFMQYSSFVIVELIIHFVLFKKGRELAAGSLGRQMILDLLQIPLSFGFTRFMNLFSWAIPQFDEDMAGTFWGSFAGCMIILFAAIVLTGIGAAMSLNMRIIPNPGDGIVQAISDAWGKSVGFTKNCFDAFNICISISTGLLFTGHLIGIGAGTVCAVLGVGRVVAVHNHFLYMKSLRMAGLVK